jgi:hypothetical protein
MLDKNKELVKLFGEELKLDSLSYGLYSKVCIVDPAKEHLQTASLTIFDPNTNKE